MNFLREIIPLVVPFVPLLSALIWPATILIILLVFKDGIRGLAKSVAEAKIGDSVFFKFWQVKSDALSAERSLTAAVTLNASRTDTPVAALPGARWDKVASFFWLGSDLDWTAQTVLRGAPKERIVHGLTQSYHHAAECGLGDTAPGSQLAALKTQVEGMQDSALERNWRANFVEQLYGVISGFSDVVKGHQPDFRPSP